MISAVRFCTIAGSGLVLLLWSTRPAASQQIFSIPPSLALPGAAAGIASANLGREPHATLIVSNFERATLSLFRGDGTGAFSQPNETPSATAPANLLPVDFTADGITDLVVASNEDDYIYFQVGTESGGYAFPRRTMSGHDPAGLAAADMNDDGKLDVIVSTVSEGSRELRVLLGDGTGTFNSDDSRIVPLEFQTYGVASGDFNEDGEADVAAVSVDNRLSILLGDGSGALATAASFATGAGPRALDVADIDHDGHLDVVVGNSSGSDLSVFLGDGHASFSAPTSVPVGVAPATVLLRDVDGDGLLDVIAANTGSADVSIARGKANGRFGRARHFFVGIRLVTVAVSDFDEDGRGDIGGVSLGTDISHLSVLFGEAGRLRALESLFPGTPGTTLATGDIDGDGVADLAINFGDEIIHLVRAAGPAGFDEVGSLDIGATAAPLVLADVNRDGRNDVIAGAVSVALARADGSFAPPVQIASVEGASILASGDFDRDGLVDIAAVATGSSSLVICFGHGDGTFDDAATITLPGKASGLTAGDFDHDGSTDLAVGDTQRRGVTLVLSRPLRTFDTDQLITLPRAPSAIASADFDGDGRDDVVATIPPFAAVVLFANPDGSFTPSRGLTVGAQTGGLVTRDLTGDNRPELIVVNSNLNSITVFVSEPNRDFSAADEIGVGLRPRAVVSSDFDGDGRYDLAAIGSGTWIATNALASPNPRGEANGDRAISAADLVMVRQQLRGTMRRVEDVVRDDVRVTAGVDANGDGKLDTTDLTAIIRRIF